MVIIDQSNRANQCCEWLVTSPQYHDNWLEKLRRHDSEAAVALVTEVLLQENLAVLPETAIPIFDIMDFADAHDDQLDVAGQRMAIQVYYVAYEMRPYGLPPMPETRLAFSGAGSCG